MVRNIHGRLEVKGVSLDAIIECVEPLSEEWHARNHRPGTPKRYKVTLSVVHPSDTSKTIRKEEWPVSQDSLTPENSTVGNKIQLGFFEYDGVLYDVTSMPFGHGEKHYLRPLFDKDKEDISLIGDLEVRP